jgi:hypothetical protein
LELTYKAVVGKLYVSPHPNADRIQVGHICGSRVIVDLSAKDGDMYVYFECDGQLSEEFCTEHNLYRDTSKNKDKTKAGFFEDKRRVRAQPFRGVKSEGYAVPLDWFTFTGYNIADLKEGDQFDELNGVPICQKYYTPATRNAMQNGQKKNLLKAAFPEHWETTQYRYASIYVGDLIILTEKEHGTSVRYGLVEIQRDLKWWEKLLRKPKTYMDYILGSRRAILPTSKKSNFEFTGGFYGSGEPYALAARKLYGKLKEGEIIYGELVGYTPNGPPMFTHSLTNLPELEKTYDSPITYSYGCIKGEARLRVYRITQNGRDLSWFEIEKRTKELGVEIVTEVDRFIYTGEKDSMDARIQAFLEGPSLIDSTHIREGVCVRVENEHGVKVYKEKSFSFKVAEGIAKNDDTYVDAEEVA